MELCGTEEEEVCFGLFIEFVDNKKNKEYFQLYLLISVCITLIFTSTLCVLQDLRSLPQTTSP